MRLSQVIVLAFVVFVGVRFAASLLGEYGSAVLAVVLVLGFLSFMKRVVNA